MIKLHIQIQTNTPSLTHTHTLPLRLCTTMMKGGLPMPCYSQPMPNRGEGGIGEYGGFDNWHEHGQGPLTAGCIGQSEGVVANEATAGQADVRQSLRQRNLQGAGSNVEKGEVVRGKNDGLGGKGIGLEGGNVGKDRSKGFLGFSLIGGKGIGLEGGNVGKGRSKGFPGFSLIGSSSSSREDGHSHSGDVGKIIGTNGGGMDAGGGSQQEAGGVMVPRTGKGGGVAGGKSTNNFLLYIMTKNYS